jgi:ABC-type Fe3+-hydroxamate transport system substrate-binding protein
LGRPASQALDSEASVAAYGNTTYAYLSDETLNLADGDAIIVFTFPVLGEEAVAASDQYLAEFEANPLWQSLSAAQNGRVFNGSFAWARGNTYLLANAMIDDLFAFLTDTEATTPNPITQLVAE